MARTRNLKPAFFKNEVLADLGAEAMLLYAGLWTIADRDGRLEDRPKRIKVEIFPYTDVEIDKLLELLRSKGFVVRYQVDGANYLAIPTWHKHQTPHLKEQASTIPAPDMHGASTGQAPDKNQTSPEQAQNLHGTRIPLTLNPSSLTLNTEAPDSTESLKVVSIKPKKAPGELSADQQEWFEEFWGMYWRKDAKKAGIAAFAKQIKTVEDWVACKARLMAERSKMMQRDEEKRPLPATWLNREDFHDSATAQTLPLGLQAYEPRCPTCRYTMDMCSCRYNPYV